MDYFLHSTTNGTFFKRKESHENACRQERIINFQTTKLVNQINWCHARETHPGSLAGNSGNRAVICAFYCAVQRCQVTGSRPAPRTFRASFAGNAAALLRERGFSLDSVRENSVLCAYVYILSYVRIFSQQGDLEREIRSSDTYKLHWLISCMRLWGFKLSQVWHC